jgi:hypothetical protein
LHQRYDRADHSFFSRAVKRAIYVMEFKACFARAVGGLMLLTRLRQAQETATLKHIDHPLP